MRYRSVMTLLLALFTAFPAFSLVKPEVRVRASELENTPMTVGLLKLTITQFRGSFLKLGPGQIEIRIENPTSEFASFSPQKLSLVGKDNLQVDIASRILGSNSNVALRERRLAPGAVIEDKYQLDHKVKLPARLFYEEKLLAEITE